MVKMNVGVVVFLFMFVGGEGNGNGLSYEFYESSCPQVERIVEVALVPIFANDFTSPAGLLRLMFHDCQVQGCDASILLDSDDSEMGSTKNYAIRHRGTIGAIKTMLELACPQKVSCADILILAAREAVARSGGPRIRVPLGRRDAIGTSRKLADASLPLPNIGVNETLSIFAGKGMTIDESVAILGAHTLGITHCHSISDRLNRRRRGVNASFLRLSCPLGSLAENMTFIGNDLTNLVFDNQYFRDVNRGRGILRIDADMSMDPRTAPIISRFGMNQDEFFETFSSAFIKLSHSGVLTGNQGVIVFSDFTTSEILNGKEVGEEISEGGREGTAHPPQDTRMKNDDAHPERDGRSPLSLPQSLPRCVEQLLQHYQAIWFETRFRELNRARFSGVEGFAVGDTYGEGCYTTCQCRISYQ